MQFLPPSRAIEHFGSANCPAAYQGLKIITSLALRFPDFQRKRFEGKVCLTPNIMERAAEAKKLCRALIEETGVDISKDL